jgi:DNA processing protein
MFPKRNRIMAGLSDAVLVIEAKKKSGSLITADLGLSYNKDVGVVPGSIFNVNSAGTHALLYDSATPITSSLDILQMLGLEDTNKGATPTGNLSTDETLLIEALAEELYKDDAGRKLNWPAHKVNTVATSLTLKNLISDENGMLRRR